MTTIKERINNDVKDAMRAKDQKRLQTLRLITAAIKQIEVDTRLPVESDGQLLDILSRLIKQRHESIAQFTKGNRDDLVAQEQFEIDIITGYMPEPLSDEDIASEVSKALKTLQAEKISDMGRVIAHLKPILQGRADMGKVSALVKSQLS